MIYDIQALGKRAYKKTGMLVPSGLPIQLKTKVAWEAIDQVRIVPRRDGYVVEVVYQKAEQQAAVDPKLVAALDPGVNTLATLTSTKPGFIPRLVSGKPIKSRNQYYNKQREHHQKHLAKQQRFSSRKLDQITTKRNRRINAYLHTASRRIIDLLVEEGIGKNPLWKQEVEMGKKNNRQFVQERSNAKRHALGKLHRAVWQPAHKPAANAACGIGHGDGAGGRRHSAGCMHGK